MTGTRLFALVCATTILVGCFGRADRGKVNAPSTSPAVTAREGTLTQVNGIIAKQLNLKEGDFSPSDPIIETLGADELDMVELVMALEDHFGITFPDTELTGSERQSGLGSGMTGQQLADIVEAELQKQ